MAVIVAQEQRVKFATVVELQTSMRKLLLPFLLSAITILLCVGYGVAKQSSPSTTPLVTVDTPRRSYPLGEAIPITYRVQNAAAIRMQPIHGCGFGDSDLVATVSVRDADNAKLERANSNVYPGGGQTLRKDWKTANTTDTLNINDTVNITRPGTYKITVRVTVMRPASLVRELVGRPVTIRVVDSPAERAKRKARILYAATVLRDARMPPQKKADAITALRYNRDPEALPVLLDAYNARLAEVRQQTYEPLALWHDPQAVCNAAYAYLKPRIGSGEPINKPRWIFLIADSEIRAQFPRGAEFQTEVATRNRIAKIIRKLEQQYTERHPEKVSLVLSQKYFDKSFLP